MGSIAADTTILAARPTLGMPLPSSLLNLSLLVVIGLTLVAIILGDLRGSFGDRPGEASAVIPEAGSA